MRKRTGKRILAALLGGALAVLTLAGCGQGAAEKAAGEKPSAEETVSEKEPLSSEKADTEEFRQMTDAAGNTVEVPARVSRIAVTPIPWSSVIYAIDGTAERMVCIHPGAIKAYEGSFFEKMVPDYAKLDTSCIGTDFSINMEEMVNKGVQAVVIWDYQTDEAEQLKELGIAPIMLKNETVEELQDSFRAIGELLGKEEKAQEFIDLYGEVYEKMQSYQEEVAKAEKPKVLYLRTSELKLQGNDNFIKEALELGGGDNVAADSSDLNMEEILEINPDIIFLSWFDEFTPEDLYNNKIDGQDWSSVKAVQEKRVYKTPIGVYRWDAPGVETPLMMMWLATKMQPEIFADFDMEQEIRDYFQTYFATDVTQADIDQILCADVNSASLQEKGN